LLQELIPKAPKIGFLVNPNNPAVHATLELRTDEAVLSRVLPSQRGTRLPTNLREPYSLS
jgi:hypothetical protein